MDHSAVSILWKNEIKPSDVSDYVAMFEAAMATSCFELKDQVYKVQCCFVNGDDWDVLLLDKTGKRFVLEGQLSDGHKPEPLEETLRFFEIGSNDKSLVCELVCQSKLSEDDDFLLDGRLLEAGGPSAQLIKAQIPQAALIAGNSQLRIEGIRAFLSGILGTATYSAVRRLIDEHPEVCTIVFTKSNGCINDAINPHTGRLIREAGLNTELLADSDIFSGAVDLFAAGVQRIAHRGAKIGIHSWGNGNKDMIPANLPRDHPVHQNLLTYLQEVLGKDNGAAFYFRTLDAAPFDGRYDMSIEEMRAFNLVTGVPET